MKQEIYTCDICKKEFNRGDLKTIIYRKSYKDVDDNGNWYSNGTSKQHDVCKDCSNELDKIPFNDLCTRNKSEDTMLDELLKKFGGKVIE